MSFATPVRSGESIRARPDTKPRSIGREDCVQTVMLCLSRMSHKYFDWSNEIVRADMSRVMCMPMSWERSRMSLILNRAPSYALNEASHTLSLQAANMSST
jgi:hypothetical protein